MMKCMAKMSLGDAILEMEQTRTLKIQDLTLQITAILRQLNLKRFRLQLNQNKSYLTAAI